MPSAASAVVASAAVVTSAGGTAAAGRISAGSDAAGGAAAQDSGSLESKLLNALEACTQQLGAAGSDQAAQVRAQLQHELAQAQLQVAQLSLEVLQLRGEVGQERHRRQAAELELERSRMAAEDWQYCRAQARTVVAAEAAAVAMSLCAVQAEDRAASAMQPPGNLTCPLVLPPAASPAGSSRDTLLSPMAASTSSPGSSSRHLRRSRLGSGSPRPGSPCLTPSRPHRRLSSPLPASTTPEQSLFLAESLVQAMFGSEASPAEQADVSPARGTHWPSDATEESPQQAKNNGRTVLLPPGGAQDKPPLPAFNGLLPAQEKSPPPPALNGLLPAFPGPEPHGSKGRNRSGNMSVVAPGISLQAEVAARLAGDSELGGSAKSVRSAFRQFSCAASSQRSSFLSSTCASECGDEEVTGTTQAESPPQATASAACSSVLSTSTNLEGLADAVAIAMGSPDPWPPDQGFQEVSGAVPSS